jgi:hypothetical protein
VDNTSSWYFFQYSPCNQVISSGFPWVEIFLSYALNFLGVRNLFGCVICSGSSSALLISFGLRLVAVYLV